MDGNYDVEKIGFFITFLLMTLLGMVVGGLTVLAFQNGGFWWWLTAVGLFSLACNRNWVYANFLAQLLAEVFRQARQKALEERR